MADSFSTQEAQCCQALAKIPSIDENVTRASEPLEGSHQEWIPFMLRKSRAFSLALVLLMFVGLLELLSQLEQRK